MSKIYKSIGLMSGTSMDGIDLALIESDGKKIISRKNFTYLAYNSKFKEHLRNLIYKNSPPIKFKEVENKLTLLHAELINSFLEKNKINHKEIDIIGFHGHTISHAPEQQITWQIGNSNLLANKVKINVISDFRVCDLVKGGQGAPLVPIYHFYLFHAQEHPILILNIGGISNITYFSNNAENSIKAFDICFGNAPFDDLVKERLGSGFDKNGELSKNGNIDFHLADHILQNEIFYGEPPKSFDRNDFTNALTTINNLKLEDALATLAYIHAKVLKYNINLLTKKPKKILICGGGRKNITIIKEIKKSLPEITVQAVEEAGFNGDSIEAEAFAFLAIRSLLKLPISFKNTTGIRELNSAHSSGIMYKSY